MTTRIRVGKGEHGVEIILYSYYYLLSAEFLRRLSSNATYAADWKMWIEWRQKVITKEAYIDTSTGEEEAAEKKLARYMTPFLFFSRGKQCRQ